MSYAFITGMGRSGTTFLGSLLAKAKGADAHHEKIGNREFWLVSWYLDGAQYAVPYLEQSRAAIDARPGSGETCFVDVNGYLANAVPELTQVFDGARVFHLVRDPRKVIPSLYARRNDRDTHIVPKQRAELEWWMRANKFEQICWNWASTTLRLHEQGIALLNFESIIGDYDYLKRALLDPCGLVLSRAEWEATKSRKVNRTRSRPWRYLYARVKGKPFVADEIPSYPGWSDAQRETMARICGPAMRATGYEV